MLSQDADIRNNGDMTDAVFEYQKRIMEVFGDIVGIKPLPPLDDVMERN